MEDIRADWRGLPGRDGAEWAGFITFDHDFLLRCARHKPARVLGFTSNQAACQPSFPQTGHAQLGGNCSRYSLIGKISPLAASIPFSPTQAGCFRNRLPTSAIGRSEPCRSCKRPRVTHAAWMFRRSGTSRKLGKNGGFDTLVRERQMRFSIDISRNRAFRILPVFQRSQTGVNFRMIECGGRRWRSSKLVLQGLLPPAGRQHRQT